MKEVNKLRKEVKYLRYQVNELKKYNEDFKETKKYFDDWMAQLKWVSENFSNTLGSGR